MVPAKKSTTSGSLLALLYLSLNCTLQVKALLGLLPLGRIVPVVPAVPLVPNAFFNRPHLLTSGAAPVVQPLIPSLLGTVGGLTNGITGALGLGQPRLPEKFFYTRRPFIRPGATPNVTKAADGGKDWGYANSADYPVGPNYWHRLYPKCSRTLQSPIDISGPTLRFQHILPMSIRTLDGAQTIPVHIKNDGASVSVKPNTPNMVIEGGSLPGQFVVTNVHFHWSQMDMAGSEHTFRGRSYPLEMHIVTFNRKYRNMQEAMGASDGIHVIAVLYEISKRSNMGLSFCTSKLDAVCEIGTEVDGGNVDVSSLIPSPNTPLFRYRGSLTTPPCTDNIIWSVYATPQVISLDQLHKFRRLKLGTKTHPFVGPNVRPVQPMDNRVIFTNSPNY